MWSKVEAGWKDRLKQDETQVSCSRFRNNPSEAEATSIMEREAATIVFPADGGVVGNWREGEKIAQNGRGGQFSDGPDTVNGGNCYACHQLARSELSYGTLGPSLTEYGKNRQYTPEAAKDAFAKIYNSQATFACSNMPRFGYHKFLTEQQIKDVVAYLLDPESPVNK
jgi:sulfur-oxidizing protein SoxX